MSTCHLEVDSNENEIILRQLQKELNELSETTEAKLLRHDGKIAELCLYLKDNLSNSIREVLDSMELTGELDEIIASVITKVFDGTGYVNISNLGAKEKTDISDLLNMALSEYHNVYIPKGEYIVSKPIKMKSFTKLKGSGKNTIINFTGESFIIKADEYTNFIQVEDLNVYNKSDEETIAINIFSGDINKPTTDSQFKNLWFTDFTIGIYSGYAWCNSFYDVRFNTCLQPLKLHSQSNNNNFYSCKFLSTTNSEKCEFVNNDLTSFFGCEFANYIKGITRHSKLLFNGCYFENIGDLVNGEYSDLFLEVGSSNEKDQVNIIDFVGCHHTGNTLDNDRYLKLKLHSKVNGYINSDIMKLFIDGVNTLNINRPMKRDVSVKYMSAHSKYNQNNSSANYLYSNGKILQQNVSGAYMRMNPIEIKKGDKIHVDLSVKTPVESYLHFHYSDVSNPQTGTKQTFTIPKSNDVTRYSIDFIADNDYKYCTLHQFNNSLLDYIVISKMGDTKEIINQIESSSYYMDSKPSFLPDRPLTIYSTKSNDVWTFNGTSWN